MDEKDEEDEEEDDDDLLPSLPPSLNGGLHTVNHTHTQTHTPIDLWEIYRLQFAKVNRVPSEFFDFDDDRFQSFCDLITRANTHTHLFYK